MIKEYTQVNGTAVPARQTISENFAKSLSIGITDTLFAPSKWPWVLFDLILSFSLFLVSVRLSPYGMLGPIETPILVGGIVYAAVFTSVSLGQGFYDRARRFGYYNVIRVGVIANLLATLISVGCIYFLFYEVVGRLTIIYGTVGAAVGLISVHMALAFLLGRNPFRFTIIGQSDCMQEIINYCKDPIHGQRPYQYIALQEISKNSTKPAIAELQRAKVSDIVFTKAALTNPDWVAFAIHALKAKLRVVDEIDFYTQVFERLPIDEISHEWVLRQGIATRQILTQFSKRAADLILSGASLVLLSPIFILIAIAIKASSPGPVIFVQNRQGRYSKSFKMYKFRTMRFEHSSDDAEGGFTRQGDDRVTWIGKLIRPLHLDELPQLWNCFIGQMSLIGPRPEALRFANAMRESVPLYEMRYLVRPGLTGHAQLNQGYAMNSVTDTKKKLSYDLYYLCFHSVHFDLYLMLKTIFHLSRGAR